MLIESSCSRAGYSIFGVQFATQCYCGNILGTRTMTTPPLCTRPCPGNPNVNCGGYYAMKVYSATIASNTVAGARTSTVDTFVTSTTTASSTTIVSSSSASPSTQAPRPISNDDVTLSKGAIAGISVGSAVGAVLICAAICCFWFYQHHQRSRKVSEEVVASPAGQ